MFKCLCLPGIGCSKIDPNYSSNFFTLVFLVSKNKSQETQTYNCKEFHGEAENLNWDFSQSV